MTAVLSRCFGLLAVLGLLVSPAAGFLLFEDMSLFMDSAGDLQHVDFTDLPDGTLLANQYQVLGLTFPQGDDYGYTDDRFQLDEHGISGGGEDPSTIGFDFDEAIASFGIAFPGALQVEVFDYLGGLSLGSFVFGPNPTLTPRVGAYPFGGIIAEAGQEFGYVEVTAWANNEADLLGRRADVDDLFFSNLTPDVPPVPEPATIGLTLLGLSVLSLSRKRRKNS
ncbi:MAG: PEP-CTERM sorting domain-containing protein [Candidatus Eisenbacteria bacterium]|uniref:PEP-CTERM sorting domain-containing protein n=1 Tax=Eiseniibacteriota bacterium TaxID=2212470 RepID=A0A948W7C4_UNCEI|nr:PEP-CTERM sorting domain-containing protein [Candidatus Eisenbacteria bacterium]MBU1948960.1 PEP-CTERM sorting domain-containing protein [Candidatus Eisenbacteria bacterium]MBU2691481.1 PEP-CTERM sorting domain-containing protein [Candidatus Eisenbacteria bacterium]